MLTGHCLCGRVRYEADAELSPIIHCHCETCRRAHGSAFSSIAAVPRKSFRRAAGEELLSAFQSSPGKFRRFCSLCGSHLVAERVGHGHVMVRPGWLDTPVKPKVMGHIWRSDAARWYDPNEPVAEFAEAYVAPG